VKMESPLRRRDGNPLAGPYERVRTKGSAPTARCPMDSTASRCQTGNHALARIHDPGEGNHGSITGRSARRCRRLDRRTIIEGRTGRRQPQSAKERGDGVWSPFQTPG
jgi:hypothetical protein